MAEDTSSTSSNTIPFPTLTILYLPAEAESIISEVSQKLEQKIGEALGLEIAAQKAVEELSLKGLLDQAGLMSKLEGMKKEANNHQIQIEELVEKLSGSEELDSKYSRSGRRN